MLKQEWFSKCFVRKEVSSNRFVYSVTQQVFYVIGYTSSSRRKKKGKGNHSLSGILFKKSIWNALHVCFKVFVSLQNLIDKPLTTKKKQSKIEQMEYGRTY